MRKAYRMHSFYKDYADEHLSRIITSFLKVPGSAFIDEDPSASTNSTADMLRMTTAVDEETKMLQVFREERMRLQRQFARESAPVKFDGGRDASSTLLQYGNGIEREPRFTRTTRQNNFSTLNKRPDFE